MGIVAPAFTFLAGPSLVNLKRGETVEGLRFEQSYDSGSFNGIVFQVQAFQLGQSIRVREFLQTGVGHSVFI
ncbi:MAG: hypothetical protein V3T82_07490, partial [Nitrospinaceae bacterium]